YYEQQRNTTSHMFRLSERQCPVSGYARVSQGQALFEGAIICGYKQLPLRDSLPIKWAVDSLGLGKASEKVRFGEGEEFSYCTISCAMYNFATELKDH